MTGRIFINYRRGDDPGFTQALYQKLETEFGRDALFMDVEGHIKAGDDFVKVLDAQVAQSDILLAVIGPRWVAATDDNGRRRLDNPDDFVRIEIESAMERGKRVIPVLVNNADMPRVDELPEPMKAFARRNARRLTVERFAADTTGLVKDLRDILEELEKARQAATETQRREAEEAARRKQDEETARAAEAQRQAEARSREQVAAGLSGEEIRKAEELANWDFIKTASSVAELRNHLARFPGGVTERYARTALEELVWSGLGATPEISTLDGFLEEFPKGKHAEEAAARRNEIRWQREDERKLEEQREEETQAWLRASGENTPAAYRAFLKEWPSGANAGSAKKQLRGMTTMKRLKILVAVLAATTVTWFAYSTVNEANLQRQAAEASARRAEAKRRERAEIEDKFQTALGRVPRECTDSEYSKYTKYYDPEQVAEWKADGHTAANCIDYYGLKE